MPLSSQPSRLPCNYQAQPHINCSQVAQVPIARVPRAVCKVARHRVHDTSTTDSSMHENPDVAARGILEYQLTIKLNTPVKLRFDGYPKNIVGRAQVFSKLAAQ